LPLNRSVRHGREEDRTLNNQGFYVITGASAAGKSTLLKALGDLGYSVVPEVALTIVQEQEQCGGNLFTWTNLQAFMEEVLIRNVQAYDTAQSLQPPVFFDRREV
jgi:predicted ATPase